MTKEQHVIPDRQQLSEEFRRLLDAMNIDGYGVHFENDVFYMHPYCWCDDEHCAQCGESPTVFNFYHKASDFGLNWYKYAMRSAEASESITIERFSELISECIASIPESTAPPIAQSEVAGVTCQEEAVRKINANDVFGKMRLNADYRPFASRRTLLWDPEEVALSHAHLREVLTPKIASQMEVNLQIQAIFEGRLLPSMTDSGEESK